MGMKEKSKRVLDAEALVESLREQLQAAQDERDKAVMEDCGLEIGGIVRSGDGCEWQVSRVSASSGVYGFGKKKDGSWSNRERYIGLAGYNVHPVQIEAAQKS